MKIGRIKNWNPDLEIYEGVEDPYVFQDILDLTKYDDITSITNIEKFFSDVRERRHLLTEFYGTVTWTNLSVKEKEILAKNFIVEKTLRDEVLTASEQESHNYYKIYDYVNDDIFGTSNITQPPHSIDYKIGLKEKLHPDFVFDNSGLLTECIYYKDLDITTDAAGVSTYNYSNPILKYNATYTFSPNDYAISRTVTRSWYKIDGTLDTVNTKTSYKVYKPFNARNEGRRRRTNLINNLLIETVYLFMTTSGDLSTIAATETDAIPFMKEIAKGISEYYEYGNKKDGSGTPCVLIQNVTNSTYTRLDNIVPNTTISIREFIISRLDV